MSDRSNLARECAYALAQRGGPGLLAGITAGDWLRLLWENGFEVDASCWPRAAAITAFSVVNSAAAAIERLLLRKPSHAIQPPLFILGHWRSGTTHLHNLLALDDRLAAPTLYQVLFPRTFRLTEKPLSRMLSALLARRRGFDNVEVAFDLPNEDEFAVCLLSLRSPYMSLAFPRRRAQYRRFLTFKGASPNDIRLWQIALRTFVEKFTLEREGRPLLKSPPHTCRIALLLEVFPDAKFLHIHRHPYAVFQSRRAQILGRHVRHYLQRDGNEDVVDEVIAVYREMHDTFFAERGIIPPGNYHEIEFDDLARDPLEQLTVAYDALSLGQFERVEERMAQYVKSVSGYARNDYPEVPKPVRERLASEWQRSFTEWGYHP